MLVVIFLIYTQSQCSYTGVFHGLFVADGSSVLYSFLKTKTFQTI